MNNTLNALESNDIQMVKINGKELTVVAKFDLFEMFQAGGSKVWERSGKRSRAICLAGDKWIIRIPRKEQGQYIWLICDVKEYASNLTAMYRDGDGSGGPAKKFAQNGQSRPVPYGPLYDQNWEVVDIGALRAEGNNHHAINNGDHLYFVTSRWENNWLLYLDARHGEAKGTGVVLIGQEFNPDVDVEATL